MVKQLARRSLNINLLNLQKGLEQAYPFSFGDEKKLDNDPIYIEYAKNNEWLFKGGSLVKSQYKTLDHKLRTPKEKVVVMLQTDDTDNSTIVGV